MSKIPTLGTGDVLTEKDKAALRKQQKIQLAVQLIGNVLSDGIPFHINNAEDRSRYFTGKELFDYCLSIADSVDSYAYPPEVSNLALDS